MKSRDANRADQDCKQQKARVEREDTALVSLSKDDRNRLGMDSWEPSLLRQLLTAQNRLNKR